jgi:agmatine deiminase
MNKIIFSVFFIFLNLGLFAQREFTEAERSKYHMNSPEEFKTSYRNRAFSYTAPPVGGTRSIAEFEPNQGVIIAFPNNFAVPYSLISQLSQYVKVYIVCSSFAQSYASSQLQNNGVNMENVSFVNAPIDSQWTRDFSPIFIEYGENNKVGIVDFPYNRPDRTNDDNLPIVLGEYWNMEVFGMNLVHTGGNYMTDGLGIAASCDLVYTENPSLSQQEVSQLVQDYIGIENYHLVNDPLNDYIEHIDCWGKFLAVDKILITRVPASDSRYAEFEAMADYWANQPTSYGNKYKVFRTNWGMDRNAYTNSLIVNNKVFIPFNTGNPGAFNADAATVYEEAMPGYEIIGIEYNKWFSTDALHCRTHEVPDFEMLKIAHLPYVEEINFQETYDFNAEIYSFNNSNSITEVKLIYSVNNEEFVELEMENISGNTYNISLNNLNQGDTIRYYIQAKDNRPKTETLPYIGQADPFSFTIKSTSNTTELTKDQYIKAFPNPATNILYFISNNLPNDNYEIEIYNQFGQIIKKLNVEITDINWEISGIDISDLKSGLYSIIAKSGKTIFTTKFIKL